MREHKSISIADQIFEQLERDILSGRYSRGEISRDFLILERFRYPLSFGHGLQPTEAFCRHVGDLFLQLCADKPGLVEGARPLMEYLQSRGYRLHMCSNGFHEVQYKKLRACGLEPFFHTIVLSEDAGYNKPAPEFFDYALRVTGASRATTLMIGDNLQTDILGARRAGLATAFFNRYPQYPTSEPVDIEVTALSQLRHYL